MKNKLLLLGALALVSAGIWYLISSENDSSESADIDSVGPIQSNDDLRDLPQDHIRNVMHKSKELVS